MKKWGKVALVTLTTFLALFYDKADTLLAIIVVSYLYWLLFLKEGDCKQQ